MDHIALRNKLAVLTRGQEIKLKLPELIIEVAFTEEGLFRICAFTNMGSSSVESTPSLKEAVNKVMGYYYPRVGHVYQHINSNIYTVVAIANEHSLRPEYPPSVVYRGENGLVWCKPLENFQRKMTRIK